MSRKVVVVGGGPAGLEAARVSAERGHTVTLLEAGDRLGGQVQLSARTPRHSEKLGITEWLAAECRRAGVDIKLNCYAEAGDVLALDPDTVVVATGGLPNTEFLESGGELVLSTWDVLGGKPLTGQVLVYDDHGGEQALTAAERLLDAGAEVEIVSPDRMVGQDVTGTIYPGYLEKLYAAGATLTPDHELVRVRRAGRGLAATLRNPYSRREVEREVAQVVVEHGTLPVDEVYQDLLGESTNLGELDLDGFVVGASQSLVTNPTGRYRLFRIGDAVSHRNIHAAMYDARRLCMSM